MSTDNRTAGVADNPTAARQIALIKSSEPVYDDEGNIIIEGFGPVAQYMQKVVSSQPKTVYNASQEIQGTVVELPADQSACWMCQPGDRPRVALVLTLYKTSGLTLPSDLTSITLQPFLGLFNPGVPEFSTDSFEVQAPLPVINMVANDFVKIDAADSAMSKIVILDTYGFPWLGVAVTELTASVDTITMVGYPC